MPNPIDLDNGERIYLIRVGKRIFALRAAVVEAAELHHPGQLAEARRSLRRRTVAVTTVADSEADGDVVAQKVFVSDD